MKTKKEIDEQYEDILWNRDIGKDKFPHIATVNLAYPTQLAFDSCGEGSYTQETIYRAIIINYHLELNRMFKDEIERQMLKPIRIMVKSDE